MLRQLGLDADVVGTGRAAVEAVDAFAYDVVLMDVQMPEMDGLDAARAIRAADGPQPAIVALTANAIAGDQEQCLAAGMDGYLSKPVRLDALRDALSAATGRTLIIQPHPTSETADSDDAPATTEARIEAPAAVPPAIVSPPAQVLPSVEHVLEHMRALTAGDDALADEILDAYLRTDRLLIRELQDPARCASAAHKLKASSGTLGASALAERASALEQAVRSGTPSTPDAGALADDLRAFRRIVLDVRERLSARGVVSGDSRLG